ncbi:LacI family DNA-binding transcriptional regulator [Paenibacillus spongiae]|uniref:LacI family transcriptional regulator n=1 Tax=Paenibacillus spongiae TaxID=2909671 RepID=A0ABY5S337_9BACL|nr:LacI family DNA-binding transcriptional regulator [Paenibacillus spongiae]UVI27267.1 LacI family transcriptional regulator [Paenibacillus spongiae]
MSNTLESIAKLAGVSRGTVSRVINRQPGVKQSVREKVMAVIAEAGYVPNPQARSLAGGKTENIGVVVFGNNPLFLSHHLFFEVLQGIQSHSTLNAYDLVLFSNRSERDKEYWKRIGDKRKVDGLIIMGEDIREEYLQYYYDRDIPFVLVGKRLIEKFPVHCVTSDYRMGAYEGTKHMLDQGLQRIVILRGLLNTFHENERFSGFAQALEEAGLDPDNALVLNGQADKQTAYGETSRLLHSGETFDGVFAGNDLMAFGVIEALRDFGLRVPDNVAVVGYDDIQAAPYFTPPLTSVRQDKLRLGQEAAQLLMKLLNNELDKSVPVDVMIDSTLIIRQSSLKTGLL